MPLPAFRSMLAVLAVAVIALPEVPVTAADAPPAPQAFELHRIFGEAAPDRTETKSDDSPRAPTVYMENAALMNVTAIESASAQHTPQSGWQILVRLTPVGAKQFFKISSDNVGKQIGIVLGGKLVSSPRIHEPISGPEVMISGSFTEQAAQDLVAKLNAAAKKR